jgi:hypothetical protein
MPRGRMFTGARMPTNGTANCTATWAAEAVFSGGGRRDSASCHGRLLGYFLGRFSSHSIETSSSADRSRNVSEMSRVRTSMGADTR